MTLPRHAARTACRYGFLLGLLAGLGPQARADQGLIPYVTAISRDQESNAVTFAIFQLERYDSNFFRLSDGIDTPDRTRRSVVTSITGVGLNLEKSYGLQRIVVNASTSRELYSSYANLDDTGSRVYAALYWSITPNLTGDLTIDYARVPTDYEYLGFVTKPNPRTTRQTRLNVDFRPGAALHPRLVLYEARNSSQDTNFQLQNSRGAGAELAILYDFASGNRLGVYGKRESGRDLNDANFNLLTIGNQRYRSTEYGGTVEYRSGGQAKLTGRLGYMDYTGETTSLGDFSGVVGSFDYVYDLTGKTRVRANVGRTLFSSLTTFSSYVAEDSVTTGVDYQLTGKLTLRPDFSFRKQTYKSLPTASSPPLSQTSRYYTLRFDYAALRSTDIALSVTHSSRTSSFQGLQFKDNSASVFARFRF